MNKSELMEILDVNNFVVEKSEMFSMDDKEFIYSYNEGINHGFVIKEYKSNQCNIGKVLEDVLNARIILRKHNINIWNSYFLVLIDFEEKKENEISSHIYNIERNSSGLRKYVIIDKEDLLRIPFIKTSQENIMKLNFSSNLNEVLFTEDKEVGNFINWILEEEGEFQELKRSVVKEKINKLFIGNDL